MTMTQAEILLVEDDPTDQKLVRRVLSENGLSGEVRLANDGQEALDFIFGRGDHTASEQPADLPRLVLLDLNLPKVDGLQVLRAIKSDSRTRGIPVVVMSSSTEPEDLFRCYQEGVNSYVQKAVDFEQYRQMLSAL